ncbi:hypothetical protein L6Q79_07130 [bacterium]|nr:hypothetical protein [bacterium]NUN44665.1 hypothetical protein [bacterium]
MLMLNSVAKKLIATVVAVVGFISTVLGIIEYLQSHPNIDLNGEWRVTNTIEHTSYAPFLKLKLGYRIFIHQDGAQIKATGEKCWENDVEYPFEARTPITLEGTIEKSKVWITFSEHGKQRASTGTITWIINENEKMLKGHFTSTAADANGSSIAERK